MTHRITLVAAAIAAVCLASAAGWAADELKVHGSPEDLARFKELAAQPWKAAFTDPCTEDWTERWFLDGEHAKLSNGEKGMAFHAGPKWREDAHHAVLWTKPSFEGDVKIEYQYTRLDEQVRAVTILYIQATGKGEGPYATDIRKWSDRREVPSMSQYFKHMNTYHISYAAWGTRNEDPENDYIRARRYRGHGKDRLHGTELEPDYDRTGLFETGVPHRITVIKRGRQLYMHIRNDEAEWLCHWDGSKFPAITEGRIGLRHMYTRAARYKDFRISVLADERSEIEANEDVAGSPAAEPKTDAAGEQSGGSTTGDGYGLKFLADNVELNAYSHHDMAEYAPAVNKTFLVYQSTDTGGDRLDHKKTDGDAYAVAFDHQTRTVLGPYRVGFNPITADDNHGPPALTIDGEGYIHVFFGSHNSPFQYARSAKAYDISAWVHPPTGKAGSGRLPGPRGTYPSPAYNPGDGAVYVVYRGGVGEHLDHVYATLLRSADGGKTWKNVNDSVLDFGDAPGKHYDAYVKDLDAWAGRVHVTWTIAEGNVHDVARRNVYHAAYNPRTGHMQTIAGEDLGPDVSWAEAIGKCLVKNTGDAVISGHKRGTGDSIRGFNHAYDPQTDTVYIAASYGIDGETSVTRLYSYENMSKGGDGRWAESPVIVRQSPPSPHVSVRVNEAGEVEINKPDAAGNRGLWIRRKDGSFTHRALPENAPAGLTRPVTNGVDAFGWYATHWLSVQNEKEKTGRHTPTYAYGQGMAGSATHPRPPRNLRLTRRANPDKQRNWDVVIDWDEGLAGPAGVKSYHVYVDGRRVQTLSERANDDAVYPPTFAYLKLDAGKHRVWVTLSTGDGVESEPSNTIEVSP